MFKEFIPDINVSIKKTKKVIISLGCSFVQGQGAINENIYKDYRWYCKRYGGSGMMWNLSSEDKRTLVRDYPDIPPNFGKYDNQPNFVKHQYNNSFVNVLCNKYFNGEYTPINLGIAGCGNRATIKELYFYPDILWDEIEECIIVYCPSGLERFDFINDTILSPNDHNRWVSMWPNQNPGHGAKSLLWEGYKKSLHSRKFEVLEQIAHVQELLLWCKFKKAKLVIVPAFNHWYSKEEFTLAMTTQYVRNTQTFELIEEKPITDMKDIDPVLNMWPWENMFQPNGSFTFSDLMLAQEKTTTHYYEFMGIGSPNGWITPCSHPSAKGHDLFASYLHKHIIENPQQCDINRRIGNF